MRKKSMLLMAVMALLMSVAAPAQEWQRLSAKLMTPWGEQIDPDHVWQEYPRPQLVRPTWMNLNGVWEYFRRTNRSSLAYEPTGSRFNQRILVPFGVESALSGIMHTDLSTVASSALMYRRTFTLTSDYEGKRTLLHFGAVDWQCIVYVNGKKVGEHKGGSDPFTFDITDYLVDGGEQELQVAVYDPSSKGGQPRGKQTTSPSGIWYTSCSGIWQTVWLEPVNAAYVERYEVVPDAASGTVRVKVIASDPTCKVSFIVRDGEKVVVTTDKYPVGEDVTIAIPDAKLWSPDSPFLYNLDIYLSADNCMECDRARGYFGLRTLSKAMINGHPGFLLNGKPIFMYGPLDQGWWPDGLLTPPSYEAMIYDLQTIKSLGMNMVRKHIKVENDLWYEWCDRNGLIVWQDMPSGSEGGSLGTKAEIQHNFYLECENIVTALKQHPSIGVWVPYNEGWGQDAGAGSGHTMRGYLVVRNADADMGRLMNAASGWTDFGISDITDAHSYPSPNGMANTDNDRVNVCGEFGGITLMVDGHLWAGSQQTYTQVSNSEEYTIRFNQYTSALQALQQSKGLWAGVYTQITDVEQEVNGILTYDRKVLKVNEEQLASIRSNIERTIRQRLTGATNVVSAGDNASTVRWHYVTSKPAGDWFQPDFDDSSWREGTAGFGKISQPDARVRTDWSTPEIWIRRHFKLNNVSEEQLKDLCIRIFYDEDSEVYINGVLAMTTSGYNVTYQLFDISDAAREALHIGGDNVIAIHTKQTTGGQYIDAGFSLRSYADNAELTIEPMADSRYPQPTEDPSKAYLLCYSKEASQQMFYSYSYDGASWFPLNSGKSVFAGVNKNQPLQDPFIYRQVGETAGTDVFHLVFGGGRNNEGLYHWTSTDLLSWTPVKDADGKVLDANVHAPELIYDPQTNYFVYYWSAQSSGQWLLQYMRSKDLTSFGRALSYFTPGYEARDLHIFPVDDQYVALFLNPGDQGLCTGVSRSLSPIRGHFQNFRKASSVTLKVLSASTYPSFDGRGWFLLGMESGSHTLLHALSAKPLEIDWKLFNGNASGLPADANGGKVLVISRAELSQLLWTLDGIQTGVPSLPSSDSQISHPELYNLQGQRVVNATRRGIYITQGKKLLKQ